MNTNLRPDNFNQFIGQTRLKDTLKVLIESTQKRKKQLDHILFHGQAGLGKTSLAIVLARELNAKIKFAQGPLLEKKADILSLFSSITKGDVIFIDEIHSINKGVEELIYSAMEDKAIDITIGPDGDQRIVRMKLPDFTLIGATTQRGRLSIPLKDRFGLLAKLQHYEINDLVKILENSAKKLKVKIEDEAKIIIAKHSKHNPRVTNNLLKRSIDFMTVSDKTIIDKNIVEKTFHSICLYKYGLSELHIAYLSILNDTFYETWVSIETISGILQERKEHIEKEIEVDLLENGLIKKSSRGRISTTKGTYYLTNIKSKK